jgi:hypothetical protein
MSLPHAAWGQKHPCCAEVMISGFGGDLDADAWLWRIPDGRHYQVACFHVPACLSEIPGPYL